jgi:hypothetical protein
MPVNKELAKHRMSETEWEVLSGFELLLNVCPCNRLNPTDNFLTNRTDTSSRPELHVK